MINLKTIQKSYDLLSKRERFALMQSAVCRKDTQEMERIFAESPRRKYTVTDFQFYMDSVMHLHALNLFERLNHQAFFEVFLGIENNKYDDTLSFSAYMYVVVTDAWKLIGDEFGFDVMAWRKRQAEDFFVISRLENRDELIRGFAFPEDEAKKHLMNLPERLTSKLSKDITKVELKTLKSEMETYRSILLNNE